MSKDSKPKEPSKPQGSVHPKSGDGWQIKQNEPKPKEPVKPKPTDTSHRIPYRTGDKKK